MSEVKILLCDDDPDLLGLLLRRLQKMGIEPDVAGDGRVAKGFVNDHNYDVIVTDIYMPEATGLEVMQHAKQKDADTQVVIITSSATLENAIDALNHGAFGYLTKPFDHLIVFDNMVSRALEYRQLVVADKRKAEAQRRRGDMLEDEVAQRVVQLQKTQKGLLNLLGSLPDGILVVEEGGKVVLSSPVGERWLALDQKTDDQPIHVFVGQVHAEHPDPYRDVTLDGKDLHLMSADFPAEGDAKRKAVIIREIEDDHVGAGSMVTDTVMGIKKGLATLYEQGVGTEVVLNVASQFAVLEQLQGWSGGTGELEPSKVAPETSLAEPPAAAIPAEPPAPAQPPSEAAPEKSSDAEIPTPAASATDSMQSVPPFSLPRERTPTGELEGPRLNTAELQDVLRQSAPGAPQDEAATPIDQAAQDSAPEVDPAAETLISSAQELSKAPEVSAEQPAPDSSAQSPAPTETETSGSVTEAPSPIVPDVQDAGISPAEANIDEIAPAEPVEVQGVASTDPPPVSELDSATEGGSLPASHPEVEAPPEAAAGSQQPPWEDPDGSDPETGSFPRAVASSADVPSWIDGVEGITDPDLLQDFEFEAEQQDDSFPTAQAGDILDDDSMYSPRVIPEEMDAKLKTPLDLPNTNGGKEQLPPKPDGPITIQAAQADTQMFRNVLKGLSGTEVVSGDYEKPPEEPPNNGDAVSHADEGIDELLGELTDGPAADAPAAEAPPPSADEFRSAQEPIPEPVQAQPAQWPPKLPTQDEDWDDELDVTG